MSSGCDGGGGGDDDVIGGRRKQQRQQPQQTFPKKKKKQRVITGVAAAAAAASSTAAAVPFDDATPITADGDRPQKRFYRQRAHCNPLAHNDSYEYPISPQYMQWKNVDRLYPQETAPTVLDIGCGFGGLTLCLARLLPTETILGMEIRAKVTEFVRLRIVAARKHGYDQEDKMKSNNNDIANQEGKQQQHHYNNCAVMRTNSMKFLPNYMYPQTLNKMFFCFPDPHFKRKNHPRRIISETLLTEYAYLLRDYGRLYCITDVQELHDWHIQHLNAHPLFRKLVVSTDNDEQDNKKYKDEDDPCIQAMKDTEEGQKVDRNGGTKYFAVYERIPSHEAAVRHAGNFFD